MSESTFDFASLKKVDRVITRKVEKKEFAGILRIKGKAKGGDEPETVFKFSDSVMTELGLELNSLEAFVTEDGKTAIIAVVPGNGGNFFKKIEGKAKGDRIKHNELSNALDAAGYASTNAFKVEAVGVQDGKSYYKLVPASAEEVPTPRAKKEKKAVVAETPATAQ